MNLRQDDNGQKNTSKLGPQNDASPISLPVRPGSVDPRAQQSDVFPLDAFEFDDPKQKQEPTVRLKRPWKWEVQSDIDALEQAVSDAASDDRLDPGEKITMLREWQEIYSEKATLDADGVKSGLASQTTAYDSAFVALSTYLNAGTAWISGVPSLLADQATVSVVDGAVLQGLWTSFFNARAALTSAIRGQANVKLTLEPSSIKRDRSGILTPNQIAAKSNYGNGDAALGRFRISLSHDGQAYQDVYSSATDEASKSYTVPATMTVGAKTHYVTSVRVQLYAAGGFETLLGTGLCSVAVDSSAAPIYCRVLTVPPANPLANDYYFDGRAPASGGGVIRYWSGSAWVIATPSWPMYGEAWTQASVDAFNWQTEQGVTLEETVKLTTATARAMAKKQIVAALPAHPYAGYQVGDIVVLADDKKLYRLVNADTPSTGGWSRTVDGGDITANSIVSGSINCVELASSSAFVGALEASTAFIDMLSANTVLAQYIGASTAFINSFRAQDVVLGAAEAYLSIIPDAPGTSASPKIKLAAGNDYIKLTNAGIEFKTTIFDVQSQMSSFTSGLTVAGPIIGPLGDYMHSDRDFPNGTLIKTSIDYSQTYGAPFVLEIKGNSYGRQVPIDVEVQGYIYNNTIINCGASAKAGLVINGLVAINVDGNLCFWFPFQSYWEGYYCKVYIPYSRHPDNKVISITDVAKPANASKEVAFDPLWRGLYVGDTSLMYSRSSLHMGGNCITYASQYHCQDNGKGSIEIGTSLGILPGNPSLHYPTIKASTSLYIACGGKYVMAITAGSGQTELWSGENSSMVSKAAFYGAVGNDYADALDLPHDKIAPGKVASIVAGRVVECRIWADPASIGIVTDTHSFCAGRDGLPIAVAGFVLAYVDGEYPAGTKLTSSASGELTMARKSDRVLATFVSPVIEELWNGKAVAGRMLVKVV